MPSSTTIQLITDAMMEIGVLASGEVPSAAEAADCLRKFNQMVDGWNAEHLMIYTEDISEYPLVTNQQTYTYGLGGDFNAARPPAIDFALIKLFTNPAQPTEIPIAKWTDQQWGSIPVKSIQSQYPQGFYDDGSFPLRNISFWPIPTTTCSVIFYVWRALSESATLKTNIALPPGYLKAMVSNLAVDISPMFERQPSPVTVANVVSGKQNIKVMNTKPLDVVIDSYLQGSGNQMNKQFNYYTGNLNR